MPFNPNPYTMGAGLGLGLIGSIGQMFGARKANQRLNQLLGQDPTYQISPYAQQKMGMAQQLYGGRMFGADALERNIFGNQASYMGNVGRNASDATQALSMGAASQGQTNQALEDLQTKEAQNKYAMLQNLNNSYDTMTDQQQKMYEDQVRRYSDLVGIRSAQQQNRMMPWQSLSNLGGAIMGLGASGFGNGMWGKPSTGGGIFGH